MRQMLSFIVGQPLIRKAVISTPGVRSLAWRFVAGEDLEAGVQVLRALNAQGIKGTLNYIGTHVTDKEEAAAATEAIIEALMRIDHENVDANLSIKLTQIGLDVDEALCRANLRRILECAARLGNFIRIDMEESPYVEKTLNIFEEMQEVFGAQTVGIVLQSYLRRRREDLERLAGSGSRIRLVKGGYWESAETVYRSQAEIENAFRKDLKALMARGQHPAIATHDPRFINLAQQFATEHNLPHGFEFQFLYGVRPDLQKILVQRGYTVRCYVPYGGNWYAYLLGCLRRVPEGLLRRGREWFRPQSLPNG